MADYQLHNPQKYYHKEENQYNETNLSLIDMRHLQISQILKVPVSSLVQEDTTTDFRQLSADIAQIKADVAEIKNAAICT